MLVRIEAHALPGRSFAAACVPELYDNIHVGVQRGREVVDLVPGDAASAEWSFDVTTRPQDFGGPFVHGKRGDRFLYLSWGTVDAAGTFTMFRRAKLHFADIPPELLASGRPLVARLGLTDSCGNPLCARVRPPTVSWSNT